jgi:hypothetical protein
MKCCIVFADNSCAHMTCAQIVRCKMVYRGVASVSLPVAVRRNERLCEVEASRPRIDVDLTSHLLVPVPQYTSQLKKSVPISLAQDTHGFLRLDIGVNAEFNAARCDARAARMLDILSTGSSSCASSTLVGAGRSGETGPSGNHCRVCAFVSVLEAPAASSQMRSFHRSCPVRNLPLSRDGRG